jgi:hypothetical protein
MGQKPLSDQIRTEVKELRAQGWTVPRIARDRHISQGSVSNILVGEPKPARATTKAKQAVKSRREPSYTSRDIPTTLEGKIPATDEAKEAINRAAIADAKAREAEAMARVRRSQEAEEAAAARAEEMADLRKRLKEAEIKEVESRAAMASATGSSNNPALQMALDQAKAETLRVRDELRDTKHTQDISELSRQFTDGLAVIAKKVDDRDRVGKTSFDLLSEAMGRVERVGPDIASTVFGRMDRFLEGIETMVLARQSASVGLSPFEYQLATTANPSMRMLEQFVSPKVALRAAILEEKLARGQLKESELSDSEKTDIEAHKRGVAELQQAMAEARAKLARGSRQPQSQSRQVVMQSDTDIPVRCPGPGCGEISFVPRAILAQPGSHSGICPGCGYRLDLDLLITGKSLRLAKPEVYE